MLDVLMPILGVVVGGATTLIGAAWAGNRAWKASARNEIRALVIQVFAEAENLLRTDEELHARRGYGLADAHDLPTDYFQRAGALPYWRPLERANTELGLLADNRIRTASRDFVDATYIAVWGVGRGGRAESDVPSLIDAQQDLETATRVLVGT